MALVQVPGRGLMIPSANHSSAAPAFTSMLIDATGEKVAFCGMVWFSERTGTKDIHKVGFRFGAVTKTGGSALTVSLQDVSATTAPLEPDETQDQTVAIANADAGFAANSWYQTGAFNADRTVAFGAFVAVVIEYDGGGRLAADLVNITGLDAAGTSSGPYHFSTSVLKTAGTWVGQMILPNVILEFSDGTFGTLDGAFPASAVGTLAFANNTAGADEYALEFTLPGAFAIEGAWAVANFAGNFNCILYDGTSAMTNGTIALDKDNSAGNAQRFAQVLFPGEVVCAANTTYRLAFQPSSVTAITMNYFDVSAAGHMLAHWGGQAWALTSRVDVGAWAAPTATRRLICGIIVSSIDGGGAGGGVGIFGS